jgi:hypothetical protein
MTKVRNKTFVNQVLIRDLGLCRCCGFKATEVHHIIPLIFGGEDNVKNMVSLCYTCHIHDPDTKKEFYRYMKEGGAKTSLFFGRTLDFITKQEIESKGVLKFSELLQLSRQVFAWTRECDISYSLENFNVKDSLEVENVDFTKEIIELKNEFKDKQIQTNDKGEDIVKV